MRTRSNEQLQNWAAVGDALFADLAAELKSADDVLGVLMAALMAMYKNAPDLEKRAIVLDNLRTLVRALEIVCPPAGNS